MLMEKNQVKFKRDALIFLKLKPCQIGDEIFIVHKIPSWGLCLIPMWEIWELNIRKELSDRSVWGINHIPSQSLFHSGLSILLVQPVCVGILEDTQPAAVGLGHTAHLLF